MSKIVEVASAAAVPVALECGVEVIEVEYKKTINGMELTYYIDTDKEGGISLIDCEQFHRSIDPILEELDPTGGSQYQLSVSSPGIDRPLKVERDYNKNLNKEVIVSLYEKIDQGKKFVAILRAFDLVAGKITVEYMSENIVIDMTNIALIKPEIKF